MCAREGVQEVPVPLSFLPDARWQAEIFQNGDHAAS
jgi:hypothetical protein